MIEARDRLAPGVGDAALTWLEASRDVSLAFLAYGMDPQGQAIGPEVRAILRRLIVAGLTMEEAVAAATGAFESNNPWGALTVIRRKGPSLDSGGSGRVRVQVKGLAADSSADRFNGAHPGQTRPASLRPASRSRRLPQPADEHRPPPRHPAARDLPWLKKQTNGEPHSCHQGT